MKSITKTKPYERDEVNSLEYTGIYNLVKPAE